MSSIAQRVQGLAQLDFVLIQEIENEISQSKSEAMMFVADPDKYMKTKMSGKHLPSSLHFHVRAGDSTFPADVVVPESQIVISTTIHLNPSFRDEVIQEIHRLDAGKGGVKPLYCDGCAECKIEIIK